MDIVAALKRGNHETFLSVLNDYHIRVFRFFCKRLQDAEHAKELTQQCFVRLWEHRLSLSGSHTLEQQLFAIAKSLLSNDFKKKDALSRFRVKLMEPGSAVKDSEPGYLMHDFEQHDFINTVFSLLPKTQKDILYMKFVSGYTNREIALRLSLSIKTVEGHISKAYCRLRQALHNV